MANKIDLFTFLHQDKSGNVAAILWKDDTSQKIIFKTNILINQVQRDGYAISKGMIKKHSEVLENISWKSAHNSMLLYAGAIEKTVSTNECYNTIICLLYNANNTIASAMTLFCNGYKIQPMILMRNILENIAVASHLLINPNHLEKYNSGHLNSAKTIASLKKIVPPIGALYGMYSDYFVHISTMYRNMEQIKVHEKNDDGIEFILNALEICVWCCYVISELISLEYIAFEKCIYWKANGKGKYIFQPTEAGIDEMSRLLSTKE